MAGIDTDNITCADFIIDYLYRIGVRRIFGVPGGAIEPLFDALARHARHRPDGIRLVVTRHESGAAFMAAGYARETGQLGVCCSTTGPGATNLITGVAAAFVERDPILVITPQTALPDFGRLPLQDSSDIGLDTVAMFSHATRFNSLISHSEQLERKLIKAISAASRHPQGPAHLSIPMDILAQAFPSYPCHSVNKLPNPVARIDDEEYSALYRLIINANKIVLLLGDGCGEAVERITAFAELTNSAIVTTPLGKTWVNGFHYLNRGVFGFAGHESARQTLVDPEVDVVLAIGSRLDELSTSGWDKSALFNYKLVHIDSTFDNFHQSLVARLHVGGNMAGIFQQLIDDVNRSMVSGRYRKKIAPTRIPAPNQPSLPLPHYVERSDALLACDSEVIKPQRLMWQLGAALPQNIRIAVDAGNAWSWAIHYLHLRSRGNFHIGIGFGAMTWAIGTAIGIASADADAPVAVITGDGSMLMGGQEISVAVAECLPVLFVVLNDRALGMVKHGQQLGGAEPIGYQLPPTDFAAVARAMGAVGHTVRNRYDLERLDVTKLLSGSRPTLLDVHIDPEEVPPMAVRVSSLHGRTGQRSDATVRQRHDKAEEIS